MRYFQQTKSILREKWECLSIIKSMLLLFFFTVISGCKQNIVSPYIEETLILPLNSKAGVTTENEYSGWVSITVTGAGYVSNILQTDALYLITENNQPPGNNENISEWGILIDNYSLCCKVYQSPPFAWSSTAYNPTHRYSFQYHVGSSSRRITFLSGDNTFSDNDGELSIHVTTEPLFIGR